jgi:peptidoglycan/LPS O-acetylase OafA/YrhL
MPTASLPASALADEPASVWAPTLTGHLPALDGLRGIAILAVMIHHFAEQLTDPRGAAAGVYQFVHLGRHGVDLFFVLSGFLITGILLDSKGSPRYFSTFYARRTLRIFPLYYGVLFVVLVLLPRIIPPQPAEREVISQQGWLWLYASNILMSWRNRVMFNGEHFYLSHFWSLAVEEQFYLVWPLLVLALSRRALVAVCAACLPLALVMRRILLLRDNQFTAAIFLTPCRIDSLAVGALVAILARGPGGLPALRAPARWIVPIALVGWIAFLPSTGGRVWGFSHFITYSAIALFCGGVMCMALNAPPQTALARFLSAAPLRFFGKYSYGLYVFHYLLYPLFERGYAAIPLPPALRSGVPGNIGFAILAAPCSIAVAWVSFNLYEKQFLRLKARFSY